MAARDILKVVYRDKIMGKLTVLPGKRISKYQNEYEAQTYEIQWPSETMKSYTIRSGSEVEWDMLEDGLKGKEETGDMEEGP